MENKYVQGHNFIDTLSTTFNSPKPSLQNVGSFVAQNKDLIAKPLLGTAGDLAAFGLTAGGKALITKLLNKKKTEDPKSVQIIENLLGVPNIIGSGIKKF